jgi:hypothetical protein
MEIGYRLGRAETVNRARGDAQLAMADRVGAVSGQLTGRLDGCRELCGADSRHGGARARCTTTALSPGPPTLPRGPK